MAITDWPTTERPREKLLQRGASALSDAELLAIFLRTGCPGKSAVDLARDLLTQFQGLQSLLAADQNTFCRARGLGNATYVQLQAVLEMARRHLSEVLVQGDVFTRADEVKQFLQCQLQQRQQEVFAALFLDSQHRLLAYEELFRGTVDSAAVYPREVAKRALEHNAAAVILAHNHPSGFAEPSQADKSITRDLQQSLRLLDIRVLDHMVIGRGQVVSFVELGLL